MAPTTEADADSSSRIFFSILQYNPIPLAVSPDPGSPSINSPLAQPTLGSEKFCKRRLNASASILCRASVKTTISPRAT